MKTKKEMIRVIKTPENEVVLDVKSGNACLVIVAEDASDNTKKMFRNMCKYYEVPMEIFATKEELGHWIGKAYRASICILDEGFAKSIVKKINLNMEG